MENNRKEENATKNSRTVVALASSLAKKGRKRKVLVEALGDNTIANLDKKGSKAKVAKTIMIEKCVAYMDAEVWNLSTK